MVIEAGETLRTDRRLLRNSVLVVDDYREVRDLVSRVLQHAGFIVRTAANGLEALLAAYEMRPAVIVMDVTMPVLDGLEATRLIKAADATRDGRVIAFTADSTLSRSLVERLFVAVLQNRRPPTSSSPRFGRPPAGVRRFLSVDRFSSMDGRSALSSTRRSMVTTSLLPGPFLRRVAVDG
jgi:CheY-like chemotaxis protein